MTNLDYAKQFFKKSKIDSNWYDLNNGYTIHPIDDSNEYSVDFSYYDRDVGYVTDDELFYGSFEACIEFVKKQINRGIEA